MESYLHKDFDVQAKPLSPEASSNWRRAVGRVVKNPARRFRHVAHLAKRAEAERKKKQIQEKIRVALYVQKAAQQFIEAGGSQPATDQVEYKLSEEAEKEGFSIHSDELASIIRSHDIKVLKRHGGVDGILTKEKIRVALYVHKAALQFIEGITFKWRKAVSLLVKNRSRRFRGVVDLANQARAEIQVAKEGSDVIKLDDNFRTAVSVARWSRPYINIQKFMRFQLAINVVALVINAVSVHVSGNVPLTAVQLLWVNLIMYTVGARALIRMPQFLKGASFITRGIWRNIIGQSIYQLTVLGVLNFYGTQLLGLTSPDAIAVLDTLIFNSIVFCKVINEMIQMNRHEIEMINTFDNWILVGFMICTLAFEVVIVEFLGVVASIVPIWVLGIFIGSVSMTVALVLECTPVGSSAKGTGDGLATEGREVHRFSAEQPNAVMKLVQEKLEVTLHGPKTALLKINYSAIFRSVGEVRISAQMMQCTFVVLATFVVIVRVGDDIDFAFSMLTFLVKQNINGITTIVKFWVTFAVDYGYASVVIALLVMIKIVVEKVRCNEINDWSSRDATRFVVDYALAMLEYLLFLK